MELEHSMSEVEEDCPICKQERVLEKIPSLFMSKIFTEHKPARAGALVDEYIRDTKEEIKEYKKDLKGDFKE